MTTPPAPAPARNRRTVYLAAADDATLESLTRRRFGGNASAAVVFAVALADAILSDPATVLAETPAEALDAWRAAAGRA